MYSSTCFGRPQAHHQELNNCNSSLWLYRWSVVVAVLLVVVGPLMTVYYLTFMYSSTCLGRPHAHHQELNNCSNSLWFYRWSVVVAVLLLVVGPDWPNHDQQHCYRHAPKVKPEAATAAVELLMMGVRTPESC